MVFRPTKCIVTYSIEEIRLRYSRAYEKWTLEENELLIRKHSEGFDMTEIGAIFPMLPGAIDSRFRKLGLSM